MSGKNVYHAAVVGGGVVGLAAARQFRRLGPDRVVLLERFQLGHERGSSHGASRIVRSAYANPAYVRLMGAALREDWPRLEADSGEHLVHRTPACFFGRGSLFESFARTMRSFPEEVEVLPSRAAAARFPALRLDDAEGALVDHSAGVLAAARTVAALARLGAGEGIEFREETRVLAIEPEADSVRLRTEGGDVCARHVLIAAGSWIGDLVPILAPHLTVLRQTVAYFHLEGDPEASALGRFPVWGWIGDGPDDFYYGLPRFEREGVKVARHRTLGPGDDPESTPGPDPSAVQDLGRVAAARFTAGISGLAGADSCLYTCTADENFIIDRLPGDARIAFASACSGHGFKFGPLTGRVLAELALLGKTGVPEFEENRDLFALKSRTEPSTEPV